ncbi:hypothetical protein CAOG_04835 [Capsaspora owczarzaki ATCC 30864]|uniref:Protein kinase domain-containing protein n=1 Tax=Capsaspora owczarzaki (strain ATCC 30864) TaxID=595528 RepID=A0A0D2UGG5_CAPO3|nr:hypothetical protein CAOG_04835 [Capsaspora owczarzaki ATCC 30864]KJE94151.1 hypothetical protein CAOG_004835 [Capsaspora owczarzaki ATCC 30864]|eukprot:XP_004347586.1 hypothetical protein CAOG_04835 [Capsaspora owczarzaki ATCC 30864]
MRQEVNTGLQYQSSASAVDVCMPSVMARAPMSPILFSLKLCQLDQMASSSNSAHPAAAAAGLSPFDSSAASEERTEQDDFLKRFESFSLALGPAKSAPLLLDPVATNKAYDELAKAVANLSLEEVKTNVEGVVERVRQLYTAVQIPDKWVERVLRLLNGEDEDERLDSIQISVESYRTKVEADDAASSDTPSSAATSDAAPSSAAPALAPSYAAVVLTGKGKQPACASTAAVASLPAPSFMSQKKGKQAEGTTGSLAPATAASAPVIRPNFVITTMNGQPLLVVEVKCPTTHRVKGTYECKGGNLEPREVSENNPDSDAVKHNTSLGHLQGQLYDYLRSFHKDLGMVPYFGILTTYHEWAVYWLADDQEQHLQDPVSCTSKCAAVSDVGEFKNIILDLESRATVTTDAQWPSLKVVPTFGNVHNLAATSAKAIHHGNATRHLIRMRVFKWNDPDLVNVLQNVIFKAYHLSQLRFHPHFGESSPCLLYSDGQLTQTKTHGRVQLDFNTCSNQVVRPDGQLRGGQKPTNVYCFVDLGRGRDGHAWLASPYTEKNHGVCVLKVRNPGVTSSFVNDAIYMPYLRMIEHDHDRPRDGDPILVAAARAVDHMASLGYRHKDVRWRHVGLYRIMGDDTLYAVLIDLSDVEVVSDKAEARNSMLAKLDIDESLLE